MKVRSPEDNIDRGIGIYRLYGMAYRPELVGVEREVKQEGDSTSLPITPPSDLYHAKSFTLNR